MENNFFKKVKVNTQKTIEELFATHSKDKTLNSINIPLIDIINRGGKRIRPILTQLSYNSFSKNPKNISKFIIISEIIHNATLIIDDIEDASELRRNKKTIHKIYGIPTAINSANLFYFLPQRIIYKSRLTTNKKVQILNELNKTLTRLHIGQGKDIFFSKKQNISIKEYLKMSSLKTGELISFSLKLGAILANKKNVLKDLEILGKDIGIAFQIKDDILNLKENSLGKKFAEDITEGKKTFITTYTLDKATKKDKEELIKILKSRTKKQKEIKNAIKIFEKYSAIQKAEKFSNFLIKKSKRKINNLIKKKEEKELFLTLLNNLQNRKK